MFSSTLNLYIFLAAFSCTLAAHIFQTPDAIHEGTLLKRQNDEGPRASLVQSVTQPSGHQSLGGNAFTWDDRQRASQTDLRAEPFIKQHLNMENPNQHETFTKIYHTCEKEVMARVVKSDDEITRCYQPNVKCVIHAASEEYSDSSLVRIGLQWLIKHTSHGNLQNSAKLMDAAEGDTFDDKYRTFSCFFRVLFLSDSQSKVSTNVRKLKNGGVELISADYSNFQQAEEDADQKLQRRGKFGIPTFVFDDVSRSFRTMAREGAGVAGHLLHIGRSRNHQTSRPDRDEGNPESLRQDDLFQCLINVIKSLDLPTKALGTYQTAIWQVPEPMWQAVCYCLGKNDTTRRDPNAGSSTQEQDEVRAKNETTLMEKVSSCFQFFEYDKYGNLKLDQRYTAGTAEELMKLNPVTALALETGHAVTENVWMEEDEAGQVSYQVNTDGLARGLGKVAFKTTQLGKVVDKLTDAHRVVNHLATGQTNGVKESSQWLQTGAFIYKNRPRD